MKNFLGLLFFFLFCATANASPNDELINMAKNGYEEDLKDLLGRWDGGADINYQDADGNTALHYAAGNNSVGIMNIVMNAYPFSTGIKYNLKNKEGETAFYIAVRHCGDCVQVLLAQARSKIDIETGPITPLVAALVDRNDKIAEQLILAGANLDAKVTFSKGGEQPILILLAGYSELGRALNAYLKLNGKVNLRFDGQKTPIMVAADENMKLLLDHGALLNLRDADGNTALHLAAMDYGYDEFAQKRASERYVTLLSLGARTDLLNQKQHTAARILENRQRFFAGEKKLGKLLNGMHAMNPEANIYRADTYWTQIDFRNTDGNMTYVSIGYDLTALATTASAGMKANPSTLTFYMFGKYKYTASSQAEIDAVKEALDTLGKNGALLD
ncbi:ankyrin repeat domain-containing protein [Oxalobacteraceae bacterium CAVE-383]|nr:ankyrin repeat domain-containing protein [Oxalobacteraceae bacterium CAVE-383]